MPVVGVIKVQFLAAKMTHITTYTHTFVTKISKQLPSLVLCISVLIFLKIGAIGDKSSTKHIQGSFVSSQ